MGKIGNKRNKRIFTLSKILSFKKPTKQMTFSFRTLLPPYITFIQSWRPYIHIHLHIFTTEKGKKVKMKTLGSSHSYSYLTHIKMTTYVCTNCFKNTLYLNKKLFLLKISQLTSLFIQHNQSPDTSIFTLYSNNGSKVEKDLERKERKRNQ